MERKVKKAAQEKKSLKEPVFMVKQASKLGGLDYLHVALIALVIILVALAFSLSTFKSSIICQYGAVNGTCITTPYNSSQALTAAEKVLASYQYQNSSLSVLAYYSLVNQSQVSYLPALKSWLVVVPYTDPFTKSILNVSLLFYGSNLSLETPYMQMLKPSTYTNDTMPVQGVISLSGKTACVSNVPEPVYLITDPYAPDAMQSIMQAINLSREYQNRINMSYKFIFTKYAISEYSHYGIGTTQLLGAYLACASVQPKFAQFVDTLNTTFNGSPPGNETLYSIANATGFNMTSFDQCMVNIPTTLSYQAQLASFYNVTSTPMFISNCKYESIPATAPEAINYSLSKISS